MQSTQDETTRLLQEANLKIARQVARHADQPIWLPIAFGVAFTCIGLITSYFVLSWMDTPERAACEQLALQVSEQTLPLDRYMSTRCAAKYLSSGEHRI